MAGVNETPRQKMMGILYLVLLGLAATTITQQVLDAFRNLTVGLENSTSNVQSAIDNTFAAFAASKLKNEPERSKPYWDRANRVKAAVADLDKFIADTKGMFEKECGGFDEGAGDYKNREDVDISPRIMINKGRAEELKKLIETTRTKIIAELDDKDKAGFKMALNADDPPRKKGEVKKSWADNFFGDGIPLTAAITALTKINSDLKNTEADAIKKILGDVDKAQINFTDFSAVAIPTSPSYVLLGHPYTAEVYLTAFSAQTNPEIMVGGQKLNVAGGKGTYTVSGTHEGEFKWSATVHMKKADGTMGEWKTPEISYRVAKPSAVLSPDFLNVFYVGVDNPVSVSAPGTPNDKVRVAISNGSITKTPTGYNVRVNQAGNVTVTISAEGDDKKVTTLATLPFRAKRLPTPIAKFGGKSSGTVPKAMMTANDRLLATVDEFEFKVQYNINHFKMYIRKPHQDVKIFESTTNILSPQMKAELAGAVPGTDITFDDIFETGPDNMRKALNAIVFRIQ